VLVGAAGVSSPALWNARVEGTTRPSVALTRYLVSILLCWAALGALAMLVGPPPKAEKKDDDDAGAAPAEAQAVSPGEQEPQPVA
jgi:hypothetical protein